jgi:hypothetical protein
MYGARRLSHPKQRDKNPSKYITTDNLEIVRGGYFRICVTSIDDDSLGKC